MAMRIRSMSAGRAGASVYNANVNGDQGGGDALQGLATTTNKRVNFVLRAIKRKAYSDTDQRRMVFCLNQLGGIGRPSKMFATTADAPSSSCHSRGECNNFVLRTYRKLLNRGADSSGLKTYTKMCEQKGELAVEAAIKASPEYLKLWGDNPPPNHA